MVTKCCGWVFWYGDLGAWTSQLHRSHALDSFQEINVLRVCSVIPSESQARVEVVFTKVSICGQVQREVSRPYIYEELSELGPGISWCSSTISMTLRTQYLYIGRFTDTIISKLC